MPAADPTPLTESIDALLPQTQCTRCGYPACRDYARAIATDEADINQCPPGGRAGIELLASLLGRMPKPLNPANGVEKPREIAVIDEEICIGCAKCIAACPVDAIIGASKMMHTILAEECTGCELCIAPCPVDCIAMVATAADAKPLELAAHYRVRYETRNARLLRDEAEHAAALAARKREIDTPRDAAATAKNGVLAAIARAKAKKSGSA